VHSRQEALGEELRPSAQLRPKEAEAGGCATTKTMTLRQVDAASIVASDGHSALSGHVADALVGAPGATEINPPRLNGRRFAMQLGGKVGKDTQLPIVHGSVV
jgi:hypothetical protein